MLIAGDIGGTKTDLAIYSSEAGPHAPLAQTEKRSADFPSLQAPVRQSLAEVKMPVTTACFDVAGPAIDGGVKTTNLPWVMDERSLARDLNLKSVRLINDLEAVARSVPTLRAQDLVTLNEGKAVERGSIAIIAPGDGPRRSVPRLGRRAVPRAQLRKRSLRVRAHGHAADRPPPIPAGMLRPRRVRTRLLRNRCSQHLRLPSRKGEHPREPHGRGHDLGGDGSYAGDTRRRRRSDPQQRSRQPRAEGSRDRFLEAVTRKDRSRT